MRGSHNRSLFTINVISPEQWLCSTVYQEARLEPFEGKLAVTFVILTRAKLYDRSIPDVCLAPWQFSAWNTDSLTRSKLDTVNMRDWEECSRAVMKAMRGRETDPSKGATHYLNVDTVMKTYGKLPKWYDQGSVTVVIGNHTFLKVT